MGRKGGWFSSVKKIFISDSKKDQKQHHKSKLGCFGHHQHFEDGEWACGGGVPISVVSHVPSLPPRKDVKPNIHEADNDQQSKQAFSLALATAVAAGAAVAASQAARTSSPRRYPGKTNQEIAAIKIQIAFRGYLARRTLRGLRGLARLKALVKGQSVQRQAATTLQCMQTLSRLQSQVSARKIRLSEENQSFQRQLQRKREKELDKLQAAPNGEKWDYSSQSKEQIQAKLLNRQIAAMRREKALAYASTHQQTWKNPKSANATFMDPNNPHWGWNWLDRWMASRPWEGQNAKDQKNHKSAKGAASHTMSVGEISKLYALRDQNQNGNKIPSPHQKPSIPNLASKATPTTPTKAKSKTSSSPRRGGSWGGDIDINTTFNKSSGNNRRHSIAVSPVKEDESLAKSPSHTKASNSKSKIQSSSFGMQKKGVVASTKKQLSLPASPSGLRRYSMGMSSSNKNIATVPQEKVKVKNGGSR